MIFPKIFAPYQEKIFAGFIGYPEDFSQPEKTKFFLKEQYPEIEKIFVPQQTHTKTVLNTENFSEDLKCDGVWSNKKNKICTVKTADCIGALFYHPQKNIVAAIHAGWRGLAQKIFTQFLHNFSVEERKNFLVALSPSLGKCCAQFSDPYTETPEFFHPFISPENFVDLPHIAKAELLEMGVLEKNIEMPAFCTKCSKVPKWWSHRNGEHKRNLSFIGLR